MKVSSAALTRLPAADAMLATLRAIVSAPTAPYHERHAIAAIRERLDAAGIATRTDAYGQLFARLRRGTARPLAFVAHTDHPAFEVTSAHGREGTVRVLGGFRGRTLEEPFAARVHDDDGAASFPATIDRFVPDLDPVHNSPGRARIRAESAIRPGQWAVLDMPPLEVEGEELRMRAADDLAGCALIVSALEAIATEGYPADVTAVFTRAEETGLYGARLVAEERALEPDTVVVSVEASRALPHAPAGGGIVVRAGDLHNTFSNAAERFLRAAAERLGRDGLRTQRALLTGGTCEASTFVVHGWPTTAIALPNVNYHNRGQDERFAPEIVRLDDLTSGIALLAEMPRAVADDAREAWWASAGPVPEDVKGALRAPWT